MLKSFTLLIFLSSIISFAFGQDVLKGRVFENGTRISLDDITVQNITNKLSTNTDDHGRFSIKTKIGDILTFKGFAYMPDTMFVTDLHEHEIFLVQHQNFLEEVKVKTDSTTRYNTYYDPEFHGQAVVYSRDTGLDYTGGIALRLWWWKKDEHKREKMERELQEQKEEDKIALIFTPENIAQYVPLKGKDMSDFLALYTPEPKVYDKNDFNMVNYLSDCYKKYLELPEDKRHLAKLGD